MPPQGGAKHPGRLLSWFLSSSRNGWLTSERLCVSARGLDGPTQGLSQGPALCEGSHRRTLNGLLAMWGTCLPLAMCVPSFSAEMAGEPKCMFSSTTNVIDRLPRIDSSLKELEGITARNTRRGVRKIVDSVRQALQGAAIRWRSSAVSICGTRHKWQTVGSTTSTKSWTGVRIVGVASLDDALVRD